MEKMNTPQRTITSAEIATLLSFPIPLDPPPGTYPDPKLFLVEEPDRPLNKKEKEWVLHAQKVAKEPERLKEIIPTAPTLPALRALEQTLKKFDAPLPASKEAWQSFIMAKYFEQANDIDPKISKPALDALAKTNVVGLHTEVQEININTRTTLELESELAQKISQILHRQNEKVINP